MTIGFSRLAALRFALISLALVLSACHTGNHLESDSSSVVVEGPQTRRLLVLVYMNADNELESQAIRSFNQLESVDLSGTGISLLVLLDRSPGYDTSNGDWTDTRLFEVSHDSGGVNDQIISLPVDSSSLALTASGGQELNLGDPEVLHTFVEFAEAAYPSDSVMLVLWGHGSGWRSFPSSRRTGVSPAVGFDDSSASDPLYTQEIEEALLGNKVDILGFDCCSEAMVEVAYQLRRAARFMVASEDLIQVDGWNYADLLSRLAVSDASPASTVEAVVSSFASNQVDESGATISALSLESVDGVMEGLNQFSQVAWEWIHDDTAQSYLRSLLFREVEAFYSTPGDLNLDLVDLGRVVAEKIPALADAAAQLEEATRAAVVREWHHPQGHPNAHGLGVHYVPLSEEGTAAVHSDAYFRGIPTEYPLAFVSASAWAPQYPNGPGLLYRIWYEVF
ncbi:MAG TPA: clostripain-related cysteine peptidase, partial [Spirochaetia bacterium]|nr:clostripain-related cysteine peptidase [Spirochaetia bacterium]